jgi:hypothetical protein
MPERRVYTVKHKEGIVKKTVALAGIIGLALGSALLAGGEEKQAVPRNIVLVGWDGAGRANIKEGLAKGHLPTIERLSGEGALVAIDILRTTDTKAGWTQVLTGYVPERTGVFSNKRYQPIAKGLTVFERLERFFGPKNIVTAAIIAKKKNMDTEAPKLVPMKKGTKAEHVVTLDGKDYKAIPGEPYFYTHERIDLFVNDLHWDKVVGKRTLEFLEDNRDERFFLFVHFGEVDRKGHMFGENSGEYKNAIRSADKWTGKIIAKLEELGLYDRTLVYVTADHGFDEDRYKHFDAPYVFLATNDPTIKRRGERADIAPTVLKKFGMDLGSIKPPLDGHPLDEGYTPAIW